MAKPAARTLEYLRNEGYMVGMVERFLSHAGPFGVRQDLFGLFDIVAVRPDIGIIGIQCFTTAWTEHYQKFYYEHSDEAVTWLSSGGKIELWGWRRLKMQRGGKAVRWTPRIEEITLESYK